MEKNEKNTENKASQDTGELSFISSTVKPKHRRKLKKVLEITLLTLLLAILFGFVARLVFSISDKPVDKLLGIENEEQNKPTEPVVQRDEVKLPNAVTKPTPVPTEPAKHESGENANNGEDSGNSGENGEETQGSSGNSTEGPADPSSNVENPTATLIPEVDPETENGGAAENPENTQGDADPENTGNSEALPEVTLPVGSEENTPAEDEGEVQETVVSPLQNYLAMMEELRVLADEASSSLLKVTAITGGLNWLDENIESSEYSTGVVMGNNKVELLLMTEYAKLAMADRIEVELSDGTGVPALLYSYDTDYNLAIVAIELDTLSETQKSTIKTATLAASDALVSGEPIVALGSPNGYNSSMEFGFVTGTGNTGYITDNEVSLFTTDLSWHENGEGVIINMRGEIVGLLTHSLGDSDTYAITSAVNISCLSAVMLDLLNGIPRTYFGVKAEDIPASVRQDMGIAQGIYVNEVISGSPAAEAGIRKGDVIMNMNDVIITDVSVFGNALAEHGADEEVKIRLYRSSNREDPVQNINVVLGSK